MKPFREITRRGKAGFYRALTVDLIHPYPYPSLRAKKECLTWIEADTGCIGRNEDGRAYDEVGVIACNTVHLPYPRLST